MSSHNPLQIERHCDVAVVGGSAAGLAAALQLGRQRRSVIVVDAGEPRNAPASHMHGYLGHEGVDPAALMDAGREEVRSYGGEILPGRVEQVIKADGQFRLHLVGGHVITARRVLAATGLVDELPDIDGLTDRWGREVIHCPFCHGYEVRDQQIVQIVTHPMGLHTVELFRQLTGQLTVVLHGDPEVDPGELGLIERAGIPIRRGLVTRVVDGAVVLADGEQLQADAVVVGARFRARAEVFLPLGIRPTPHATGLGDHLETDPTGQTAVPGLYAAGNVTDPSHQVLQAAADGSRVGAMISFGLAHDDLMAAGRPSAHQSDWERRYAGRQMWSGNPNGSLIHEVGEMAPGRALDVGAGEGGDAIWLADHGWKVTAADISDVALSRVRDEADRRGLVVDCLRVDANSVGAFEAGGFDLVSAHYASIPRTPDNRGVRNLLDAVAPGGILLVVSHDLTPMRASIDTHTQSRAFDPDAYVRTDDVVRAVEDDPTWTVEIHEKRPRPAGAASATHHVDDIILRVRRRSAGGSREPEVGFEPTT